jgi:hypothetical protein
MPDLAPLPSPRRLRRFSDPAADVVWAGVMALDVALQHEVLRELATLIAFTEPGTKTPQQKVRAAVAALHEAFSVFGRSPSARDYEGLRDNLPELQLPPGSNIRKWLAGGWNDCLKRCLLPTVSDGDFANLPLDAEFSNSELVELVQACAADLGRNPILGEMMTWTRRPDVAERFPRRPLSPRPFYRHGGWSALLIEAGLATKGGARVNAAGRVLPTTWRYKDSELIAALQEVTASLSEDIGGRSPRMAEYDGERIRIEKASIAAGKARAVPSAATIENRFKGWDKALVKAGLTPLGGRNTRSNHTPRRPTYSREQKAEALRAAWAALGQPFVEDRYIEWREGQIIEAEMRGEVIGIPSTDVIKEAFGGWRQACNECLPGYTPPRRRRRPHKRSEEEPG